MKAVILAGGKGTRITEESATRPKPMIEIGGMPILWHIMKIYSKHGVNDFVICLGYKGYIIKEYFANYVRHQSDITIDLTKNKIEYHSGKAEPWRITLVDTGEETQTGGRIKRVQKYLDKNKPFCLTYGDGVSDVNIKALIAHHKKEKRAATVTAVQPSGRFGALVTQGNKVTSFVEKPKGDGGIINGGFFVLEPEVIKYIKDDTTIWENDPLETLATRGQLTAYKHSGFWQPMDTMRDKNHLEQLWATGKAPWKIW
jgi:glucose-1-phosphate cytidylyltransferase